MKEKSDLLGHSQEMFLIFRKVKQLMFYKKLSTIFAGIFMGALSVLMLGSCSKDEAEELRLPQLYDVDWEKVDGSISINFEKKSDAYAEFFETDDADVAMIKLYGVHPEEVIEMEMTTTRDDDGNILFEGNQKIEFERILSVSGVYRPATDDINSGQVPKLKINVSYDVPYLMYVTKHTVQFGEKSGLRYIRDLGKYPMASVDIEGQRDTCNLLCERINSEIGNHLSLFHCVSINMEIWDSTSPKPTGSQGV